MVEKHRTVSRVVKILETAARNEKGTTLTEFCTELDAPFSSVHGLVMGLIAEGYLDSSERRGGYVLGLGAHTLLASTSMSLLELVRPVMAELRETLNETITLAVPVGSTVSYVYSLPSHCPIGYNPPLRTRRRPWPSSAGKLFLAHDVVRDPDLEKAPAKEKDLAQEELSTIKRTGVSYNIGLTVTDVAAAAVGIFVDGKVKAALTIGGPKARIEERLPDASALAIQILQREGLSEPLEKTI